MTTQREIREGNARLRLLVREAGDAARELALRGSGQPDHMLLRGQAGRDPLGQLSARFAGALRRAGFLPTFHFVERLLQRGLAQGVRFDPRTFPGEFRRAPHYRQTRPGYTTRIAVVRGIPILYRRGGPRGEHVVLVGVPSEGRLPPVAPVPSPGLPAQREYEQAPATANPQVRALRQALPYREFETNGGGEYFAPTVLPVLQSTRGGRPRLRVLRRPLTERAAKKTLFGPSAGIFLANANRAQALQWARRLATAMGGSLDSRGRAGERHGEGLPHFHIRVGPRRSSHIFYGKEVPAGLFES